MLKFIILGGGFVGLRVATILANSGEFKNILVERKNYFEVTFAQLATLVDPESIGKASGNNYN